MQIYDSLTNQMRSLTKEDEIQIYSCGPTVYNYLHLGNARPLIVMDFLHRYLLYKNKKVNFLQNITDIDDKIIQRALTEKTDEQAVSTFYTQAYFNDLNALNILRPTQVVLISTKIQEMITYITQLVEKNFAYVVDGDVYFDVKKWSKEYGKLANRSLDSLQLGIQNDSSNKRSPYDFTLWKKTMVGLNWASPWGRGRPGWHTECAVLIQNYFPHLPLTIHAGGVDLKFPHHENERIQTLATRQKELAQIWMHNGHLTFVDQKMSKSLGNTILIKDFLTTHHPHLLRWLFLTTNYRQPLNFNEEILIQGEKFFQRLKNLRKKIIRCQFEKTSPPIPSEQSIPELQDQFEKAMENNLNLPQVLAILEFGIKTLNFQLDQNVNFSQLESTLKQLRLILDTLGFNDLLTCTLTPDESNLYQAWQKALIAGDYQKADQIRTQLAAKDLI